MENDSGGEHGQSSPPREAKAQFHHRILGDPILFILRPLDYHGIVGVNL